jgi:hypothetical protein
MPLCRHSPCDTPTTGLCPAHTHRAWYAARDLPAAHADLHQLLGKTSPRSSDRVRSSRAAPVPIRLDVDALRGEIADELERWGEILADRAGATLPDSGRLTAAAQWITDNWHNLLNIPPAAHMVWTTGTDREVEFLDGVDAALRLGALHRRARGMLGTGLLVTPLPTPCPGCHTRLTRAAGADYVDCHGCGRLFTDAEYQRLVSLLVAA